MPTLDQLVMFEPEINKIKKTNPSLLKGTSTLDNALFLYLYALPQHVLLETILQDALSNEPNIII